MTLHAHRRCIRSLTTRKYAIGNQLPSSVSDWRVVALRALRIARSFTRRCEFWNKKSSCPGKRKKEPVAPQRLTAPPGKHPVAIFQKARLKSTPREQQRRARTRDLRSPSTLN